ncbi:ThuA domain-containing protein [Asticcacaulis sp. AND118]|uniref:ThuA domain-containing protein n=1 Tax=Asticcacaulis sp. AND118 TaxID=2840468 RepID=UPI001CFFB2AB|nr:ThuA domain-containing protein [Asticcacaulis sp. AND118]UDF02471.1 ThuA domain-containing protein [Asticcacaulis sp. AND118]
MFRTFMLAGLILLASAAPTVAQTQYTPVFDHTAPAVPRELKTPAILILSKANAFRHKNMAVVATAVKNIATGRDWPVYETDSAAVMDVKLMKRFNVVVLNNTTGDLFTPAQRIVFEKWIEKGGRVVALHGAGGTSNHPWPWYVDKVIGAGFTGHPKIQNGTIRIEDRHHPATRPLPASWPRNDEWYSFDRNPRGPGVRILATVDETTYDPTDKLRMGADHPIMWTRCLGKGGAFFTALGHQDADWSDPVFLSHIEGALEWARDRKQKVC